VDQEVEGSNPSTRLSEELPFVGPDIALLLSQLNSRL